MITAPRMRRVVILGAPLLLIVFSLAHGIDWVVMHGMNKDDPDAFLRYIVDIRGRWLAVHVGGLAVFPLLGVAIWWMLPPGRVASVVSKLGLILYIVLYRVRRRCGHRWGSSCRLPAGTPARGAAGSGWSDLEPDGRG